MATNKLTDILCKGYKPTGKGYKKSDGQGMYLFISSTGSKVWRIGYRDEQGREQTYVLGPYPLVSLKDARSAREDFKKKLLKGENVKAKPKKSITFSEAAALYWAGRKDVSEGYKSNATRGLAMHIEHFVGNEPIATITREKLLELLLKLDASGKHVYAKRLRVWAGQVFDWAVELGHCPTNPAALIKPEKAFGSKPVAHHASLALKDIPDFFDRMALENSLQSVLACHMLALTWVRTGELRMMKWEQIEGEMWRVPGPVMKMKREHLVPLSKQALSLLDHLRLRSRSSTYVFPSDRRSDRPMSENAVLYLLHRIGYKGRMTGHGFRSVASTWANERGYNRDHIEMQLSHVEENEVRGAYNNALYLPQRTTMMQAWADWLDQSNASRLKR